MRLLVTAGPTREPLDPVRYLSNRSSGKMGYAVASAAAARGHAVVLISGPVALPPPPDVRLVRVNTAAEMLGAVQSELADCEALIMAAAVADWRPVFIAGQKIKKHAGNLTVELEPTADILRHIKSDKGARLFVGFAAETGDPLPAARAKLQAKGLDFIVANDVSRSDIGFDVDHNQVTLLHVDGRTDHWPKMTKTETAERLIRELELAVKAQSGGAAG
ncbi:MAG: phosphopantothenoylcysteine decarboxylase [Kiritimatiellia bacterium]